MYSKGCSKSECYQFFKDKISLDGFSAVWLGKTWVDIMPEVYTKKNKKRNASIGKGTSGKKRRIFSNEQVQDIRKRKYLGESGSDVYKDYCDIGSKSTFDGIWYYRTYINVKDIF